MGAWARQLVGNFPALRRQMIWAVEPECKRHFAWPIFGSNTKS
jgi:hypothetical protein